MNTFLCLLILAGNVFAVTKPTPDERADIVEMFTGIRENVTPTASNMNLLSYSDALESVAANWVSRCALWYPHPSSFPEINGSNMLLQETGSSTNIFRTVGFFANQAKNYNYTANTCKGNCRYYKMMAWANSTGVGCAYNDCTTQNTQKRAYSLSCVFNNVPSEYDLKQRPYIAGESCLNCTPGLVCRRNQSAKPELTTIPISTTTTQYPTIKSSKIPEELTSTTAPMSSTTQPQTTTSTKMPEELTSATTPVSSTTQYPTTTSSKITEELTSPTTPVSSTTQYPTTTSTNMPEELTSTTTPVSSTAQYPTTTSTKMPEELTSTTTPVSSTTQPKQPRLQRCLKNLQVQLLLCLPQLSTQQPRPQRYMKNLRVQLLLCLPQLNT
uniref:SCP domain-containing protein n=1 Tax=Mesocestoides corti TaxID=53468 RepID=A0A5K3FK81_MESCO